MRLPGYKPVTGGHALQIQKAAEAINDAQRPVLYVGGGVLIGNASAELTELARRGNIPVTTTLMGMGVFPETDDLSLGMLGMHGTAYANYAVTHCDLLIAVGARFDDRVTGKVGRVRPASEGHPHRHRPDLDRQERARGHPGRRRLQEHPRRDC